MTYKVVKTPNKTFQVVELTTKKVLYELNDHEEARQKYRFLKGGGGFAGETPAFFFFGNFRSDCLSL